MVTLPNSNETVVFPGGSLPVEGITYFTQQYDGVDDPASCGPGCSNVKVLETAAGPAESCSAGLQYYYYDSNITISNISNIVAPIPQIRPRKAAVAAQAIALTGRLDFNDANSNLTELSEFITYNFGTPFGEAQNNSADGMAHLISKFAIGVVAAAAQVNPPMTILGSQPQQGLRLVLSNSVGFYLLLGGLLAGQLALVVIAGLLGPAES